MLQTYLVHAYGEPDIQTPKLDWILTAHSAEEAITMWKDHLVQTEWVTLEDAAKMQPLSVSLLPAVHAIPKVHDWDDLDAWHPTEAEDQIPPRRLLRLCVNLSLTRGYSRKEVLEGLEAATELLSELK
jgi:hypothetical protein